jgi:hypothetical protein
MKRCCHEGTIVPMGTIYLTANFKETQTSRTVRRRDINPSAAS